MDISEFGLLGGEAWFYCNYTDKGDSIIGLEWFFSADPSDLGTPLLSYDPWTHGVQVNHKWNDRLNFQDKTTNTSFFISPLKREDQGIYRCTVIGDETITKEKFLEVYDPPDEKDGLKVIEDFKPLMIGETAIYTCQSSNSSPPAKLMWLINDNPAQKENIPLNLTLTDPLTGTSTSVLKIKLIGLTNLHGAKLVCRATMFRQQPKEWIRTIEVTNIENDRFSSSKNSFNWRNFIDTFNYVNHNYSKNSNVEKANILTSDLSYNISNTDQYLALSIKKYNKLENNHRQHQMKYKYDINKLTPINISDRNFTKSTFNNSTNLNSIIVTFSIVNPPVNKEYYKLNHSSKHNKIDIGALFYFSGLGGMNKSTNSYMYITPQAIYEKKTSIKKLSPFSNSYFPLPPNTLPEIYSNISMNTHDKSLLLNLGVNKMNTSFELLQNQTTKAIVEITTSGIIHNDETNTEDGIVKGQTLAPRLITNVDLFVTSPQSTSGDLFMNITTFSNDFNNHLIKNHSTMEMTTNNNLVTTALLIQNHMGNISFMSNMELYLIILC
ncbi:unnamed protein product [Gordionus sp. m RMFG-2023]